tara:strand:- start:6469 stop:6684 length:216 start_codon:yes stop_codon:yes gene_type:complete
MVTGKVVTFKKHEVKKCSICDDYIDVMMVGKERGWDDGHNAEPINEGRCCNQCNEDVVIPTRLAQVLGEEK